MANITIPGLPAAAAFTGSELIVLSQAGIMSSITAALLAAYVVPFASELTGFIKDFAGAAVPAGYLLCPTAQTNVSRTTYANLFTAIGTTWGAGDGSTTFGIPWFPADYAAVQANGNLGSQSIGQVVSHTHPLPLTLASVSGFAGGAVQPVYLGGGVTSLATGGAANLSAGVRVLKIIKF